MSDTDSNIPKSLRDALVAGEVVPFVGAGVSRAVEKKDKDASKIFDPFFPNWWEFLIKAADKLESENKSSKADVVRSLLKDSPPDYLEAAQRAFDGLRQNQWYELLSENFEVDIELANEDSLKLAKLVWQLGSNLVLTTNVDLVLQSVHEKPHSVRILDTQAPEFAEVQKNWKPSRPTVLHLHGHIDNKSNVIFTKKQYDDFYNKEKNQAKLETLRNLFTQRTILFIGFSLDDLFILKELERVNLIYEGGASSYYVLIRESEKDNSNIPKYIEKITFSEFGKPLEDLVEELTRIAQSGDGRKNEESKNENQEPEKTTEKDRLRNHFNVPFASKGEGFVGRVGKLEEIWNALSTGKRAAIGQAVSIEGFGGLGKTQLAVEYAHEYRGRYENGVYWLTADEDMSIQLIKIGESLHWISQSDTGFNQAELVRNRFRKLSDCLIIFDNVDDQKAIKDYLPEVDFHPHILATSREEQHGFEPINLDTLSPDEARELLIQTANREPQTEAEEKALENILNELDGLPLAVELVGGYLLRRKTISFQDYFEYLEKEPIDRIEEKFPDSPFAKRNKSIIRALKISEKLLDETKYLEEILDILAWSGKSSMGYLLLRELVGTDDNHTLKDALGVALELHFIKKEKNEERYAIHRLLAKVRQFEKPLTERKEWHQEIVRKMLNWFRKRKDEFDYLKEFETEIVHLQQWQSQSSGVFLIETVYLTDFEAYPLWHRGNYQESGTLLEKALDFYQKDQLNDDKLLANVYNDLGVIKGNLGDIRQSFKLIEKALSIGQNAFDGKSEDVAKFLDNLGGSYGELGNHQKALELKQQALEIRRELFGEKHPDVATSLNNLGSTYGELGNHQKALELKQQALEIVQELFGEKHPDVATSLSNLGSTYGELGNHQKALKLKQQALEIYRELFGEKHPAVAASLNNLGSTYGELGNHQKALELKQQALEIYRELFGEKHPDVATSLNNLGGTYAELGNHQKALELIQQALVIRRELFDEKHPAVARSLSNLGKTYGELGNHQKALELKQQALEIYRELFGEKHPDVATSLNNLGWTHSELGNHSKAIEHYEKALQIQQEILGNQHPDTILYCKNLILELVKSGFQEKAGRLAGEFLSYVPQDNRFRPIFERYGAPYRKAKQRKKKRRH